MSSSHTQECNACQNSTVGHRHGRRRNHSVLCDSVSHRWNQAFRRACYKYPVLEIQEEIGAICGRPKHQLHIQQSSSNTKLRKKRKFRKWPTLRHTECCSELSQKQSNQEIRQGKKSEVWATGKSPFYIIIQSGY